MRDPDRRVPHVVVVGGGFGGLTAAQALRNAPIRVTLIDRSNHHLFQPLLYQVAMAGLSPAEIAMPIRAILRKQQNTHVLLSEVTSIDLTKRSLSLLDDASSSLTYDFLILAAGARTSYFGHDGWAPHVLGLKDLDDALEIRRRVLVAFEAAERQKEEPRRRRLLTFAVIGGGPTGVELAGALAELSSRVLARDFRAIDPSSTKVLLLEAGPRILPSFAERSSHRAREQLEELGVDVRVGVPVTEIDAEGVRLGDEFIETATVIWAAGVCASPITASLGVELDRAGRVLVKEDCSIPGRPEAFVIGDAAALRDSTGKLLPGISPVAMQEARFVAQTIVGELEGRPRGTFRYVDKGMMSTIGRSRAVAELGRLRMSGFPAWLAWLFVHIWYLIGFRNRLVVLFDWFWAYVTYKRGARLITGRILGPNAAAGGTAPRAGSTGANADR